jgi:hypothetical protein
MDGLTGGNAQTFYAYQIIKLRHGQKADNPQSKVANYFLDPDGKLRKETKSSDAGFDVVVKLDKTNSSKSLKQGEEIHVPYYYDSGFTQPIIDDNKFTIEITSTDEEKVFIRQKLIEKGIIKEEVEPTLVPPTIEVNERKFTEEEIKALDKPKKKGRPKK